MRKRKFCCSQSDCDEPLQFAGLCSEHYAEQQEKRQQRDAAVRALHRGDVEGGLPHDPELREELQRLRQWWDKACFSVNHQIQDKVLLDEAEYAIEWCISLAQEIVLAEKASRAGEPRPYTFAATREWVWRRFSNLEAGLMSNGVTRPPR